MTTYNGAYNGAYNDTYIGAGLTLIHKDIDGDYSLLYAKSNSDKPNKHAVWIFPGGGRKNQENPVQTAYREFMEEVFNIEIDIKYINEILEQINLEQKNLSLYPLDTKISNNNINTPSYTFLQSSNALTIIVNVLNKYTIYSDVFPFGYSGLYNSKNKVDIYNFCLQRRYINQKILYDKNELVFITMIPIKNLLTTIENDKQLQNIYHYHGENLRIYIKTIISDINIYMKTESFIKMS